jgi:hypothetical protein
MGVKICRRFDNLSRSWHNLATVPEQISSPLLWEVKCSRVHFVSSVNNGTNSELTLKKQEDLIDGVACRRSETSRKVDWITTADDNEG